MIQAIYRSNFVLMGLPIAANIFGKDKLGMTAVLVAVVVPIYNMLAVITLEIFRGQKINVLKILKGIAKNPLIIGLLSVAFNISLPETIDKTVSDIAAVATPLALIVLGASVTFDSIKGCSRNLIICIIARLVVVPALCLGTAALIGIRGVDFVSLIGLFASPCAVSSFTMAQQMDSDFKLAGAAVVFTSVLACFTMFLWIFFFRQAGFF